MELCQQGNKNHEFRIENCVSNMKRLPDVNGPP